MMNALREDAVKLEFSLSPKGDDDEWRQDSKIETCPYETLCLKLKATNITRKCIILFHFDIAHDMSRFTASTTVLAVNISVEPAEYIVSNGTLSGIPIGIVTSGQSGYSESSICFTAEGEYLLTAEVMDLNPGHFSLMSRAEMRISVQDK